MEASIISKLSAQQLTITTNNKRPKLDDN